MFIRKSTSQTSLNPISHYFITDPTNQYQLGGPGYELTYAVSRVLQYLLALSNSTFNQKQNDFKAEDIKSVSPLLNSSFEAIAAHEQLLVRRFLTFLTSKEQWDRGIRMVGSEASDERAPTISFVVTAGKNGEPAMKSKEVVGGVDKLGGVRKLLGPDREKLTLCRSEYAMDISMPPASLIRSGFQQMMELSGSHWCTTTP
jgi:hypothetical protein